MDSFKSTAHDATEHVNAYDTAMYPLLPTRRPLPPSPLTLGVLLVVSTTPTLALLLADMMEE